ncbi:uncharacterized protein N7446_004111 [Penicillium canescens]|uniref:Polyketide synthase n=1 Tax=Penicillium canescens TaxID=5083 RepID=A0AAD6I1L4_PENCN|nr:uncharacterized protein N7446_004111 [Penicillium canescens]KAJ6027291.1 hypothetical protein N7460_012108 [Penicillium canescens]KAJ6040574.1 hypothetical protein N7444_009479 [Penicillium canescens]KAJ6067074.1 hypothetical protein N7446_004111 [Penicillium canescens]
MPSAALEPQITPSEVLEEKVIQEPETVSIDFTHDDDMGNSLSSEEKLDYKEFEPIAIVGMAMRLPGGVKSDREFWEFLLNKKDGLCRVPETRYNVDSFYHETMPHTVKTKHGYFLQDDPAHFDASFFDIGTTEASRLDPQQRLLLEVIWECMEGAGQVGWRGTDIGCYVGVFGEDWLDLKSKDSHNIDRAHVLGTGNFALSNRVSYEFDLTGPSMTLSTGCSSSLVGLHEACTALQVGDCSSALVAGTNLILTPTMTTNMSDNMVLAPDGICKTFDAAADGYGRGEAINAIYIKTLKSALRDSDPIRAVIRSTATNCDGRTPSITTPGSATQKSLIQKAYEIARINKITDTPFFECHGTGTTVGDTAEVSVVAELFGDHQTFIGSVKPNIGHGEGASGISSIIKSVLALEHSIIPPNVHFNEPNPKIPFKDAQLVVPVEQTPWPTDRKKRISVNCFGIGGSNAHVILDSAASFARDQGHEQYILSKSVPMPMILSAASPEALRQRVKDVKGYMEGCSSMQDLAYNLAVRREMLPYRTVLIGRNDNMVEGLDIQQFQASSKDPKLHFVFTGQGAQWAGMGRDLLETYEDFLADIKAMDEILQKLPDSPQWTIQEELSRVGNISRINEAELSQPLCTAVQIGIVNLLSSMGVEATTVVGHSSGEIAAAYAAGAISADTAIILAYYRGQVTKRSRPGAMAAVGMSPKDIQKYLKENVVVACENSQQSITLSGDPDGIEHAIERIHADYPDIFCRQLKVNVAYHSDHMRDLGQMYEGAITPYLHSQGSMLDLYSSVSGKKVSEASELNASYWRQNLESPVLFSTAVDMILQDHKNVAVFLEIGPHSTLSGPLHQIFEANNRKQSIYLPCIVRGESPADRLTASIASIYCLGLPSNLTQAFGIGRVLTDIPAYPWQHEQRHWCETRATERWRLRSFPNHELLGSRLFGSSDEQPTWRNILNTHDVPWLLDHKLFKDIVFPGAGYIAMAGEAIRQMTGSQSYSIQNLFLKTPLFLYESRETEILTSLRPVKLTDMVDSDFFEFTISAFDGQQFVKHCEGQVREGCEFLPETEEIKPLIRNVSYSSWYDYMAELGLRYGPRFQGLRQITTDPVRKIASGVVTDCELHESRYSLHPIVIDEALQLLGVAACRGLSRVVTKLCVPAYFESIYVSGVAPKIDLEESSECDNQIKLLATTHGESGNTLTGNSVATAHGELVLSIQGGVFFALDENTEEPEIPLGSHVEWAPDVELLSSQDLLKFDPVADDSPLLTQMSTLALLYTEEEVRRLQAGTPHLHKYQKRLTKVAKNIMDGHYPTVPEAQQWASLGQLERRKIFEELKNLPTIEIYSLAVANMIERVMNNAADIVENKISQLELLLQDSGLKSVYDSASKKLGWHILFPHLRHYNPRMRILEIGAGTGATTAVALELLQEPNGLQTFASYTFTDISHGFLKTAEDRFQGFRNIAYKILDISKDPQDQGFESASFDLIIAANVLHVVPVIREALVHVKKLLVPGGRLLMQELCPDSPHYDFILGTLPGWWIGENDNRLEHPYINGERWDTELRNAGLTGVEAICYDAELPYRQVANILSRKPIDDTDQPTVTLVYGTSLGKWENDLGKQLVDLNFNVTWLRLGQGVPKTGDVISLLDLEGPFLDDISDENFRTLKEFLMECASLRVFWLMPTAQTLCVDPRYGLVLGFGRSLRKELIPQFITIEIDIFDCQSILCTLQILQKPTNKDSLPELEYTLTKGTAHTSRFKWASISDYTAKLVDSNAPRMISMDSSHALDSFKWITCIEEPLGTGDVEVDIAYTGLNFRDIMLALGLFGEKESLGYEASGVIRRIGPGVEAFQVGDKVALMGDGLLRTRRVVSGNYCVKIPAGLSLEDAATMLTVFATAIYSLIHVGCISKGKSVLIHSACGGVGLASIQICKLVGADIFATVGSEEKIKYLQTELQIPRNRIFDSHSTEFLPRLMEETDGRGADVVLNSLAGKLLHASWQCVAPFGKMIELGKRDFLGHGKLDMATFGKNRAFFGVDLHQMGSDAPELILSLISQFSEWARDGKVKPIRPVTVYHADQISEAFRFMQQGVHMGKILVKMPTCSSDLPANPSIKPFSLSSTKAYLLAGGLGGLGRCVSNWMVEQGARHLIFFSRSGGRSDEHKAFVRELQTQGCEVLIVAGDVCNLADVKQAASRSAWPIGGVLQLSMVLRDQGFVNMTHEEWKTVIDPKVTGTWNLHQVFKDSSLDFFVMFSSLVGLAGNTGQANYAAANTFLDSFVQYRRSHGLPASVLDLGAMGDVGFVSQDKRLRDRLEASSFIILREKNLMDALMVSMQTEANARPDNGNPVSNLFAIGLGSKRTNHHTVMPLYNYDNRFSFYANYEAAEKKTETDKTDELRTFFANVERHPELLDDPETELRIMRELGKSIYSYKGQERELTDEEMSAIVIDSLISIEIRNWFRRKLSLEITLTEISRAGNVGALSELTVAKLKARHQQKEETLEVAAA